MSQVRLAIHRSIIALSIIMMTSCAQYSTRTNKAPDFAVKLANIYVWSSIGDVAPFSKKMLFAEDTFENLFNAAIGRKLLENGVKNEFHKFSASTDQMDDLARFEDSSKLDYRMLIIPEKYTTITSRGITNVDVLNLNISIVRIADNRRIWRSEIVVNCNTAPGTAWREAGADKLASQITDALRRDGLL